MRIAFAVVNAVSAIVLFTFGQNPETRQNELDECIASLSGFPKESAQVARPLYPDKSADVTLEYIEYGCYGHCPEFTLTISKNVLRFKGRAYVRAKGKHQAKLTGQQFETLLHAWYDGEFYRMRDDYCDIACPDGRQVVVTDIAESSIKLTTPTFTKRVFECFATVNNKPETPKPPPQYFVFSRQLKELARAHHWL